MQKRSLASKAVRLWISVLLLTTTCYSLKCRTDDGPSETELKRITRNCMRKIGENAHSNNGGSTGSSANSKHYGPLHQSNFGTQYSSKKRYDYNDYYDYDDDSDRYNGNSNNNNNHNNYNGGNYDRDHANRNVLQQRNRERQQNNRADNNRSTSSATGNNNGGRYDNGNGNGNSNGNGGGGGGGGNGGFTSNSGNRNSNNSGRNSGSSGSGNNNNSQRGHTTQNNNNNNNKNANNDTADAACVVHCFFEEMNMLNSDDYPDRYKVQYGLTRELRDRELRNFYTDTIQDCFHYLESQRRRDKCHYSRDLINCMSEYAKVNCDDWQEFNMVFN